MEITLTVEGMSCEHCVASITGGVKNLRGIKEVSVDLNKKTAYISYSEEHLDKAEIIQTIESLGYKVTL